MVSASGLGLLFGVKDSVSPLLSSLLRLPHKQLNEEHFLWIRGAKAVVAAAPNTRCKATNLIVLVMVIYRCYGM
jgi:hypothetical protein